MSPDATTGDTPNVVSAIAVALICFAVGAALVLPLRGRDRSDVETEHAQPSSAANEQAHRATPAAIDAPHEPTPVVAPVAHEPSAVAATTEATAEAETTVATAERGAPPSSDLQLIQGRVAYLRCDGLEARDGPFPCPRDQALEADAWAVLAELPRCRPTLERGGVDVRLDMVRGKATEVRVQPIAGSPEPTLDTDRVYACVGPSLSKLRTALDPLYMVVSLRAALR